MTTTMEIETTSLIIPFPTEINFQRVLTLTQRKRPQCHSGEGQACRGSTRPAARARLWARPPRARAPARLQAWTSGGLQTLGGPAPASLSVAPPRHPWSRPPAPGTRAPSLGFLPHAADTGARREGGFIAPHGCHRQGDSRDAPCLAAQSLRAVGQYNLIV